MKLRILVGIVLSWLCSPLSEAQLLKIDINTVNQSGSTNTAPSYIAIPDSGDAAASFIDAGGATNIPSRFYRIRLVP